MVDVVSALGGYGQPPCGGLSLSDVDETVFTIWPTTASKLSAIYSCRPCVLRDDLIRLIVPRPPAAARFGEDLELLDRAADETDLVLASKPGSPMLQSPSESSSIDFDNMLTACSESMRADRCHIPASRPTKRAQSYRQACRGEVGFGVRSEVVAIGSDHFESVIDGRGGLWSELRYGERRRQFGQPARHPA